MKHCWEKTGFDTGLMRVEYRCRQCGAEILVLPGPGKVKRESWAHVGPCDEALARAVINS